MKDTIVVLTLCRLLGRHKMAIVGRDLTGKYGSQVGKPDRICGRCGKRQVWFASYRGKDIWLATDSKGEKVDPTNLDF